ncbi:flagellar biosynthetic protein FliR [Dyella sp.]|uniref:flagellar biosynthetic protein FliR n=1 Tax=Dyella sp. TaxID=1869338 RepID=UPI002ED5EBF7
MTFDAAISLLPFAMMRFAPLILVSALTPFNAVPVTIRVIVLLGLSLLAVGADHAQAALPGLEQPEAWLLAMLGESVMGLSLSLAVILPMAALDFAAKVVDIQSGASAASLFNPTTHIVESLAGTVMQWAGMVVFFSLGLHLLLMRGMVASIDQVPLGHGGLLVAPSLLLEKLSSQFLLGLMISAPAMLGLFAIDLTVAYASRSMPQANIYFVALPLKLLAGYVLLAGSLRFAPPLIERLYRDAFPFLRGGVS